MCQRSSYQIFDRSPISAVTIKVKPSLTCSNNLSIMHYLPDYNCQQSSYDVNDFVIPPAENSATSIATRIVEIEHILKFCDNTTISEIQNGNLSSTHVTSIHKCHDKKRCILPPAYRYQYENETSINEINS